MSAATSAAYWSALGPTMRCTIRFGSRIKGVDAGPLEPDLVQPEAELSAADTSTNP